MDGNQRVTAVTCLKAVAAAREFLVAVKKMQWLPKIAARGPGGMSNPTRLSPCAHPPSMKRWRTRTNEEALLNFPEEEDLIDINGMSKSYSVKQSMIVIPLIDSAT